MPSRSTSKTTTPIPPSPADPLFVTVASRATAAREARHAASARPVAFLVSHPSPGHRGPDRRVTYPIIIETILDHGFRLHQSIGPTHEDPSLTAELAALLAADVVIVDATSPTADVGVVLTLAVAAEVPVLVCCGPGTTIPRMTDALLAASPDARRVHYTNPASLRAGLLAELARLAPVEAIARAS